MSKLRLVIRHEFLGLIRQKGFIIISLLFPVLSLLAIGGYQIIQNIATDETTDEIPKIGYVDQIGIFDDTGSVSQIELIEYPDTEAATDALVQGDITEYFVVPPDYVASGVIDRFTLKREVEMSGAVSYEVRQFLLQNLFEGQVSEDLLERVKNSTWFQSTRLDETGEVSAEQGGVISVFLVPYFFTILFWIAVLSSAFTLIEGLGDEKENRVMEILLSSVSAKQLIMGKIIGLGFAGLLQVVFWFVSGFFLSGLVSSTIGGLAAGLEIPGRLIGFGLVYFMLGYLMFGVVFAFIGAIVPTYRDGQQLSYVIVLPAAVPLMLIYFLVENTGHALTIFLTLFPVTAPVTAIIRLAVSSIPVWQIVLSWALMVGFIALIFNIGTRIFRTYLLMYGKRPSFKDIYRNLRQA